MLEDQHIIKTLTCIFSGEFKIVDILITVVKILVQWHTRIFAVSVFPMNHNHWIFKLKKEEHELWVKNWQKYF